MKNYEAILELEKLVLKLVFILPGYPESLCSVSATYVTTK